MASKMSNKNRCDYIVIRNKKAKLAGRCTYGRKRILKLNDTEFPINEQQMVAASSFLKRMLTGEKKKVLVLDDLKIKQPCLNETGLAIAIAYTNGHAQIPLNRIISALAAANALEMWDMCEAISEQLGLLAAEPKTAPFAINVAVCNLEKDAAECVVKQSLARFDEVIERNSYRAISFASFELFISLYIYENSTVTEEHEAKTAAESVARAITNWCGSDKNRLMLLEDTLSKLRPFCGSQIIDRVERLIAPIPDSDSKGSMRKDTEEIANVAPQQSSIKLVRAAAGGSDIDTNEPLTYESFRQIELPAAEPDANGIRHYSFVVEFEAPKEFLFSDKPKLIGLQLEAILECPNQ